MFVTLVKLLLVLLTALHLLAVNVATAAPLVAQWLRRRELRHGDTAAGMAGRYLTAQALVALVWGIVFGLLSLGLLWLVYPRPWFDAFAQVPTRRLWFGAAELLFYFACVYAYLYGWRRWTARPLLRWVHAALPLVAATNLAYHFAGLFAVVSTLSENLALASEPFRFVELLGRPEALARVLHNVFSAVAVSGVLLMVLARRTQRHGTTAADVSRLATWGARIALVPTLLQVLVGLYLLMNLPAESLGQLTGGDWLATGLLGLSLAAAVVLVYQLAISSQGETAPRDIGRALGWLLMTVLLMVAMRERARKPILERGPTAAISSVAAQTALQPPHGALLR